jgi:hypothetical protein
MLLAVTALAFERSPRQCRCPVRSDDRGTPACHAGSRLRAAPFMTALANRDFVRQGSTVRTARKSPSQVPVGMRTAGVWSASEDEDDRCVALEVCIRQYRCDGDRRVRTGSVGAPTSWRSDR